MNKFESKLTGLKKDYKTNLDWIRQKLERAEKSGVSNATKEDIIAQSIELFRND